MLHVNRERLQRMLEEVSEIGKDPSLGLGLHRPALSENDMQGRAYLISVMREHGLQVHVDGAMNVHGVVL